MRELIDGWLLHLFLALSLVGSRGEAQNQPVATSPSRTLIGTLVKDFKDSSLVAISSDFYKVSADDLRAYG